jgi:hypothetical protein
MSVEAVLTQFGAVLTGLSARDQSIQGDGIPFRHVVEAPGCYLNQMLVVCVQNLNIVLLVHAVAPRTVSTICHNGLVFFVFELQSKQMNKFKPMVQLFNRLPRRLGVAFSKSV